MAEGVYQWAFQGGVLVDHTSISRGAYTQGWSSPEALKFQVSSKGDQDLARRYWHWSGLHLAAICGNVTAFRQLLSADADPEFLACGVCDCCLSTTFPGRSYALWDGEIYLVSPDKKHAVWKPLHVLICSGHEELAKTFILEGAKLLAGCPRTIPRRAISSGDRFPATALHSAVVAGSSQLVRHMASPRHPVPRRPI